MRLEGQSKMGYYPTPEVTLSLIPTWLTPQDAEVLRYLDPCSGKGEAIAHVANGHAETFGIELSDARAKEAEDRLARVLNCAYEYAVLTDETFSLVLLNPPYDGQEMTGGGKRMEETFLLDCGTTHKLRAGGVLIYIIPHSRINESIARHLAGWYDNLRCFKLPGEEYDVYKQVVIFAKRKESYTAPKGEILSNVLAWKGGQQISGFAVEEVPLEKDGQPVLLDDGQPKTTKVKKPVYAPLPELVAGHGEYEVPPSPLRGKGGAAFRWQYQAVSEDDYLREAEDAAARLDAGREWRDLFPRLEPPTIEPAMTPKKGHIAMQVSGGLLGTNLVHSPDGESLLLKGNVTKYTITRHDVLEMEDDDEDTLTKVRVEERFKSLLSTLDTSGTLKTTDNPSEIGKILEQYIDQLAGIVMQRNAPQYDMKPEPWEWAVFDTLSQGRRLPGRNETGLTEFQKHLAIALGRLCLRHGGGFVNAEMGSGKTTIGIAMAEYLRIAQARKNRESAYPALLVGPGIVTGKENWPKEIPEVTPGADSRVITIGARPLPKSAKIGDWLKGEIGLTFDDGEFEQLKADECLNLVLKLARKQKKPLDEKQKNALKQSLNRAEKHPPVRRKGADAPNLLVGRIGGFLWLRMDIVRDLENGKDYAREYSVAQFVEDCRSGLLPHKSFAVMSFETAKLASGRVPAMNLAWRRVLMHDKEDDSSWYEVKRVCVCPQCGSIVAEKYDPVTGEPDTETVLFGEKAEQYVGLKRRFCQAPPRYFDPKQHRYVAGKRVYDPETSKHVYRTHDEDDQPYACGAPLFEVSSLRRVAAAEYIKKKANRFFGLCLIDECHKGKAKGSGVGWALTVLNM